MSRSYKKRPYHSICSSRGDKWCRTQYHKESRRKSKSILHRCEIEYSDCEVFKPYEKVAGCYGDICNVDSWYYDDPEKWLVNEPSKTDAEFPKPCGCCIGCRWSDNCWESGHFIDMWNESPDDDLVINKIDRSLRYADKYCWQSDGGNYYWGGKNDCRKDFNEDVFTLGYGRYGKRESAWEKYQLGLKGKFNREPPKYTVKLARQVPRKIDFGFYMSWNELSEVGFETETKYLVTEIYPPKLRKEDIGNWEIASWWRKRNYDFRLSNWDLFGFMFKSGIIPLTFKNEKELLDWLRTNEEMIISKWLRAKLLRK